MATFGQSSNQGSSTDDPAGNTIWVKSNGTPASSGTLTAIHILCARRTATATVAAALYSDSSGVPGSKLAENATGVTVGTPEQDVSVPVSASITASTQYWFALRMPNAGEDIDVDVGAGNGTDLWFENNAGFPATFNQGSASSASEGWTVWGEYTPASAGTVMTDDMTLADGFVKNVEIFIPFGPPSVIAKIYRRAGVLN